MFIIIHTATRVIRRLTIDAKPDVAPDETPVDVGNARVDIGGSPVGYWKLDIDNITLVQPTPQEISDAGVDPTIEQGKVNSIRAALIAAFTDIITNGETAARRRALYAALRDFLISR